MTTSMPGSASFGLVDESAFAASLLDVTGSSAGNEASDAGATDSHDLGGVAATAARGRPWIGRQLGHFKLLGVLGEGTMGIVIRALDVHLGRVVALKVLRKRIRGMDESQRVTQFLREARAAARIDHPSVAQIYEINEHQGWWYVATELVEGGSLHALVKTAGPLPAPRACSLIADAASALAAAHRLGIVHRDVKPQNLMLSRAGRCKLVDFGLVRVDDPNDPFDFTSRAVGTPLYVAPEQALRAHATGAADVYGLGCTLYFALTGSPPFPPTTAKEVAARHASAPRPDVRERSPTCPQRVAELVQRAMAIDPAERPPAAELEALLRVETIGESSVGDGSTVSLSGSAVGTLVGSRIEPVQAGSRGEIPPGTMARSDEAAATFTGTEQAAPRVRSTRGAVAIGAVVLAATALAVAFGRGWFTRGGSAQIAAEEQGSNSGVAPTRAVASREEIASQFSGAPPTLGLAGLPATPRRHPHPPPWSWRGRIDPAGSNLVAHRDGKVAFPVDDPRAALIPADGALFLRDEAAARAAGMVLVEDR